MAEVVSIIMKNRSLLVCSRASILSEHDINWPCLTEQELEALLK